VRAGTREPHERGRLARGGKTEQTRDEQTPARCRGYLCAGFWNCGGKGQQTTPSGPRRTANIGGQDLPEPTEPLSPTNRGS